MKDLTASVRQKEIDSQHIRIEETVSQRNRFVHDAKSGVHPQQRSSDQGVTEPECGCGKLIQNSRVAGFVVYQAKKKKKLISFHRIKHLITKEKNNLSLKHIMNVLIYNEELQKS